MCQVGLAGETRCRAFWGPTDPGSKPGPGPGPSLTWQIVAQHPSWARTNLFMSVCECVFYHYTHTPWLKGLSRCRSRGRYCRAFVPRGQTDVSRTHSGPHSNPPPPLEKNMHYSICSRLISNWKIKLMFIVEGKTQILRFFSRNGKSFLLD